MSTVQSMRVAPMHASVVNDPMAHAWMAAWAAKRANDIPRVVLFPVQTDAWRERQTGTPANEVAVQVLLTGL